MPFLLFMARFTHVIFDLDGTLADTKEDLTAATNYVLESFGLPLLTSAQIIVYVGYGARVLVERALGAAHRHLAARGFDLFMEYYQAHLLDQTRAYAGIECLLTAAHAQGVVLSVLTNKPETPSRAILSGIGLAPFFVAVVGGDTLAAKKPDPRGVIYLQRLSGVVLAETLLVGDSYIDVETGHAAGIPACGVTWGYGAEELEARSPQFLVDTPEQLRSLILA